MAAKGPPPQTILLPEVGRGEACDQLLQLLPGVAAAISGSGCGDWLALAGGGHCCSRLPPPSLLLKWQAQPIGIHVHPLRVATALMECSQICPLLHYELLKNRTRSTLYHAASLGTESSIEVVLNLWAQWAWWMAPGQSAGQTEPCMPRLVPQPRTSCCPHTHWDQALGLCLASHARIGPWGPYCPHPASCARIESCMPNPGCRATLSSPLPMDPGICQQGRDGTSPAVEFPDQ